MCILKMDKKILCFILESFPKLNLLHFCFRRVMRRLSVMAKRPLTIWKKEQSVKSFNMKYLGQHDDMGIIDNRKVVVTYY